MASRNAPENKKPPRQPEERIVLAPGERREAVLEVIRSARQRLILSLFRCDDFKVLDELAEALHRKVRVQALLTRRAKGWEKRLRELEMFLESMGAEVRRYADPVVKYHAKYMVADQGPALIASLNFTRKCFTRTCDFILVTHDPAVVSGLQRLFESDYRAPESSFPDDLSERLFVGPDRARDQFSSLLQQARHSIRIIDHKVGDPAMVSLLKARKAEGLEVKMLGSGQLGGLLSHGKMILVDQATAVIGSMSLSALTLDFRREVAVMVRDPRGVSQLNEFFRGLVAGPGDRPAGS